MSARGFEGDTGSRVEERTVMRSRRAGSVAVLAALVVSGAFAAAPLEHVVRQGETVGELAQRYDVTINEIASANALDDPDVVRVGQRLAIPGLTSLVDAVPVAATGNVDDGDAGGAPASSEGPASLEHTVAAGETLEMIARRLGSSVQAIADTNGLADPNRVRTGTRLQIPVAGPPGESVGVATEARIPFVHVVGSGETLAEVAGRYGVTVRAISTANGIGNPNLVSIGRELTIPGVVFDLARLPGFVKPDRRQLAVHFVRSAAQFDISVALAMAVGHQESGWQNGAQSHVGALGIMQLTPATVEFVSLELLGLDAELDPLDPVENITMGCRFLRYLLDQTGGNVQATLAAYNQGLASTRAHGRFNETASFVTNVLLLRDRFREALDR